MVVMVSPFVGFAGVADVGDVFDRWGWAVNPGESGAPEASSVASEASTGCRAGRSAWPERAQDTRQPPGVG